jgi:hypothetical protein
MLDLKYTIYGKNFILFNLKIDESGFYNKTKITFFLFNLIFKIKFFSKIVR